MSTQSIKNVMIAANLKQYAEDKARSNTIAEISASVMSHDPEHSVFILSLVLATLGIKPSELFTCAENAEDGEIA